jgi:hypothetical protein
VDSRRSIARVVGVVYVEIRCMYVPYITWPLSVATLAPVLVVVAVLDVGVVAAAA